MSAIHDDEVATAGAEHPVKAPLGLGRRLEQYSLVIAIVVIFVVFSLLRPEVYPTLTNLASMLGSNATLVLLTLGLIIVLRAGEFDLSIAANMTFCAVFFAVMTVQFQVPIALGILLALVLGGLIGLLNAILVLFFRVNSFIATLGMGTLLQGFAIWVSGNKVITGVDQGLIDWVVVYRIAYIPLSFFYALIVMAILWYVFRYTSAGRSLLYVGKNQDVARLSGFKVNKVRLLAFVATGVIAGGAGLLYAGTSGSADPSSGLSYMLPAFAAAFLGATAIEVGEFNPISTVIAAYFLVFGVTGLALLGVPTFIQQLFYGSALIVAVALSAWVARMKQRSAGLTS